MGENLQSCEDVAKRLAGSELNHLYRDILQALQEREDDRQNAYHERNELVAWLSKCFPAHRTKHPAEDTSWDPEWTTIVCVHIPSAERPGGINTLTWHVHNCERPLFAHLPELPNDWDGSDTETKYERLRRLP